MDNKDVGDIFEEVAVLLELKGENPFKIRAYNQAARTVSGLTASVSALAASGEIAKIKGIGKTMAAHVVELVDTGELAYLKELKDSIPEGLLEILKISGLGPKKVKALHDQLGVESIGELEYACQENRLIALKGFGPKSQANVLKGIENLKKYRGRYLWAEVEDTAEKLKGRPGRMPLYLPGEAVRQFPAAARKSSRTWIWWPYRPAPGKQPILSKNWTWSNPWTAETPPNSVSG